MNREVFALSLAVCQTQVLGCQQKQFPETWPIQWKHHVANPGDFCFRNWRTRIIHAWGMRKFWGFKPVRSEPLKFVCPFLRIAQFFLAENIEISWIWKVWLSYLALHSGLSPSLNPLTVYTENHNSCQQSKLPEVKMLHPPLPKVCWVLTWVLQTSCHQESPPAAIP